MLSTYDIIHMRKKNKGIAIRGGIKGRQAGARAPAKKNYDD
jgi:hypothetical protein